MALTLTEEDHEDMDSFLAFVLDAHSEGVVTGKQAIAALAHVFTAAAIDNQTEVTAWFRKEQYERWLEQARATRS